MRELSIELDLSHFEGLFAERANRNVGMRTREFWRHKLVLSVYKSETQTRAKFIPEFQFKHDDMGSLWIFVLSFVGSLQFCVSYLRRHLTFSHTNYLSQVNSFLHHNFTSFSSSDVERQHTRREG